MKKIKIYRFTQKSIAESDRTIVCEWFKQDSTPVHEDPSNHYYSQVHCPYCGLVNSEVICPDADEEEELFMTHMHIQNMHVDTGEISSFEDIDEKPEVIQVREV